MLIDSGRTGGTKQSMIAQKFKRITQETARNPCNDITNTYFDSKEAKQDVQVVHDLNCQV